MINVALGYEGNLDFVVVSTALTAQATVNLTQTIETETIFRS
jgi:hypothetical protein